MYNLKLTIILLWFYDSYLNWIDQDFLQYDWVDSYPEATEEHPPNAFTPRDMPVYINVFVNADHAGKKNT
jgi:hypothetical protein